jgi:hypothetical protein
VHGCRLGGITILGRKVSTAKKKSPQFALGGFSLVAGAGFEPTTSGL